MHPLLFRGEHLAINLTITSNTADYNIATAAGNPAIPTTINLTINSGVQVVGSTTSIPSITTGSLPAGSIVNITNNGYVVGRGGKGTDNSAGTPPPGGAGGIAFNIVNSGITVNFINSATGTLGGGGGGGGAGSDGGCDWSDSACSGYFCAGVGGAGGGAGFGLPGLQLAEHCVSDFTKPSEVGQSGSIVLGGLGGPYTVTGYPPPNTTTAYLKGPDGGNIGQPGHSNSTPYSGGRSHGSAGGAAGKAVNLNGGTFALTTPFQSPGNLCIKSNSTGVLSTVSISYPGTPHLFESLTNYNGITTVGGTAIPSVTPTSGYAFVNAGYNLTGAILTGLANNATVYKATITIDGTGHPVNATGSVNQTYTQLLSTINTAISGFGSVGFSLIAGVIS